MGLQSVAASFREPSATDKSERTRNAPYPFTQLPHALYAMLPQLSGSETKVLLVILRYTFGYLAPDTPTPISLSKFQRESGLTRETVSDALNSFVARGFVDRRGEGKRTRAYRIIVPGPRLVGKSDQEKVHKPDQSMVGKFDHLKESSSSRKKTNKKPSEVDLENNRPVAPNQTAPLVAKRDDDDRPPRPPEEELAEIIREKTGFEMRNAEFWKIRDILELRGVTLQTFVDELRRHLNGNWKNPIGLLIRLAERIRLQTGVAQIPKPSTPTAKCPCSHGYARRNPDEFCKLCDLGRDLARSAEWELRRKKTEAAL